MGTWVFCNLILKSASVVWQFCYLLPFLFVLLFLLSFWFLNWFTHILGTFFKCLHIFIKPRSASCDRFLVYTWSILVLWLQFKTGYCMPLPGIKKIWDIGHNINICIFSSIIDRLCLPWFISCFSCLQPKWRTLDCLQYIRNLNILVK